MVGEGVENGRIKIREASKRSRQTRRWDSYKAIRANYVSTFVAVKKHEMPTEEATTTTLADHNPTWQVPPEFIVHRRQPGRDDIIGTPLPHAVAPIRATRITVRCSTNAWVSRSFSSDTMRCDDDNDADNGDEDDNRLERRRWWKLIRIARAYIYSVNMAIYYYYTHH